MVDEDLSWAREVVTEEFGSTVVVADGVARETDTLPGLVAVDDGLRTGLLQYDIGPRGLEVVTVVAVARHGGVGSALLATAREVAARAGCPRLWLVTTNDNLDALRFYQRRGMRLAALRPGAVDAARRLKPQIPRVGAYGIALRDELELELPLRAGPRIRPGTLRDVEAALALLDDATEWLTAQGRTGQWGTEPHSTNPRRIAQLSQWAAQGRLYLAEDGGPVVGALAVGAAQDYAPPVDEPELYVNLLVTDRAHAGRDLGGRLLDHARELARRRGVSLLRVDCYGGDDRALVHWYERQGFTATESFTVELPSGPWPGQILEQRL